jgi:site-specific DNA recombinase
MKIAIYSRVSTDKQELTQQIEACRRFCEYKGIAVGKVYTDIGSGKDYFSRPGYNAMLKDLRAMRYAGVVTFRFDRLGRNAMEAVRFFEEMECKGISIFSLNENLDTTTAIGRAVRDIIVRLAQLERESIAEATKQRLNALRNMGKKLGRPKGRKDTKTRRKAGYYGNNNASKKRGVKNYVSL